MTATQETFSDLVIRAGANALSRIRDGGLSPEDIQIIAGAAGGPKWLVLGSLDRFLFGEWLSPRNGRLFLIGSSIGSWRFAAATRKHPVESINRLEDAYLGQTYSASPSLEEVTRGAWRVMDRFIHDEGIAETLAHPLFRLSFMAVRSRFPAASESRPWLAAGLAMAAAANFFSRPLLRFFFERALFYDPRTPPPFDFQKDFTLHRIPLSPSNFREGLMASGSVPLVMSGIRDIPGAPAGIYRDGGVIDYHLDIPFLPKDAEGIVLFPHYTDRIIPGWFDKPYAGRRPQAANMSSVLLIAPSRAFVKALPFGKIPDRKDFARFRGRDSERIAYWRTVVESSRRLADAFAEAVQSGAIRRLVKPL